jgi:hypothetical protein
MVFDATNRHIRTETPNTTGGTATIVYGRDATDRITARTITGSNTAVENGVFNLSYTAGGDTPDIELTGTNTVATRTVVLPRGATRPPHPGHASTPDPMWASTTEALAATVNIGASVRHRTALPRRVCQDPQARGGRSPTSCSAP